MDRLSGRIMEYAEAKPIRPGDLPPLGNRAAVVRTRCAGRR